MENIPRTPGIYQIRNIINNKLYVGSAVNMRARWQKHLSKLRHNKHDNSHLQNAYNTYGSENFVFEIIEHVQDKSKLIEREQHYIDALNVINDGYNICPFAGNTLGVYHTEESKKKMSIAHRNISDETRKKMSESGKKRAPMSEETRKKMSELHKNRVFTEEHRKHLSESLKGKLKGKYLGADRYNAKAVICVETGQVFDAISVASREMHVNRVSIIGCVKGQQHTAGGYHWKYID